MKTRVICTLHPKAVREPKMPLEDVIWDKIWISYLWDEKTGTLPSCLPSVLEERVSRTDTLALYLETTDMA